MAEEQTQQKEMSFDEVKAEFAKGKNEVLGSEYFKKPEDWFDKILALPFVAILVLLIGIGLCYNGNWLWGIIACCIGGFTQIGKWISSSDSGVDAFFADLAKERLQDNLEKSQDTDLNTEKTLHFIGIDGFQQSKKGKDGIMRFNPMTLLIAHFGKDKLIVDEVRLDALNPDEYSAKTNEFLYKDISEIIIDKKAFSRRFIIKVCGQVEIDIEIAHNQHENAEALAKAIRQKMRENGGNSGESSNNVDSTNLNKN